MAIVGIPAVAGIPTRTGWVCLVYRCFSPEFLSRHRKRMLSRDSDGLCAAPVPAAIGQICNTDRAEAERVQAKVREQFQTYITQGRAAVGFAFDEKQGRYLVEPYED